ncbi:hypothetical protein M0R01_01060 [bacterium]|nr:hypothetical protein [bacterium]
MDFKKNGTSKIIIVFLILGEIILLLLTFETGVIVGFKKADFSCDMDKNYGRNFAGMDFRFPDKTRFDGAHGILGQIIKIDENTIVMKDIDLSERIISVAGNVSIKKFKDDIKLSDLKVDDKIVVIGSPNSNGEIEAKLIRWVPAPMDNRNPPTENNNN